MSFSKQDIKLAELSEQEREKILANILKDLRQGKKPERDNKKLSIVAGLPGTGKSTKVAEVSQSSNTINLGVDDMYKYHPHLCELYKKYPTKLNSKDPDLYDITNAKGEQVIQDFAADMFNQAASTLIVEGYNLAIDTLPGEDTATLISVAGEFGYDTDINLTVAPKRYVETNIIGRFENDMEKFNDAQKQGDNSSSIVPHPYSKMRIDSISMEETKNFIAFAEDFEYPLKVVNTISGKTLHDSEKENTSTAEQAFEGELYRDVTPAESKALDVKRKIISNKMETREASSYDKAVLNGTTTPVSRPTIIDPRLAPARNK